MSMSLLSRKDLAIEIHSTTIIIEVVGVLRGLRSSQLRCRKEGILINDLDILLLKTSPKIFAIGYTHSEFSKVVLNSSLLLYLSFYKWFYDNSINDSHNFITTYRIS
jgi:hypothetical protein